MTWNENDEKPLHDKKLSHASLLFDTPRVVTLFPLQFDTDNVPQWFCKGQSVHSPQKLIRLSPILGLQEPIGGPKIKEAKIPDVTILYMLDRF